MALDTYTALKAAVASYLARSDLTSQIPDFIYMAEKAIERELNFGPSDTQDYTSSATLTAGQNYFYGPAGCIEPIYLSLGTDPIREVEVVSLRELHFMGARNNSGIPSAMALAGNMRSGSVTAVDNAGGGNILCTSAAHGLAAGEKVVHYGFADANYNGTFTITSIDSVNGYTVIATWTATGTGTWKNFQPRILLDEAPGDATPYTLYYKAKFDYLKDAEVTWLLSEYPDLILYGALVTAEPYLKNDARVGTWAQFFQSALNGAKRQQWRKRLSGGELRVKVDFAIP